MRAHPGSGAAGSASAGGSTGGSPDRPPEGARSGGSGLGSAALAEGLQADLRRAADSPRLAALFLDIDGVLAPIRPLPEEASVPASTRRIIGELARDYLMVAVVSGRGLSQAAALVDVPGIVVVGDHGRESRDEQGRISRAAPEGLASLREAAARLAAEADLKQAGVRVEVKPASIALHTRGAADPETAQAAARRAASELGGRLGLVWREGRSVIDLKLPGVDKGTAVAALLDRCGATAAVYVGDDSTDVDAMVALDRRRSAGLWALLIGVRSQEMPPALLEVSDHLVEQPAIPALLAALLPRATVGRLGRGPKGNTTDREV